MYNGVGSGLAMGLTGGSSTLNTYSHVVATWNGTSATLYVNGVLAGNTNDPAATGIYSTPPAIDRRHPRRTNSSPYAGSVDEVGLLRIGPYTRPDRQPLRHGIERDPGAIIPWYGRTGRCCN